MSERYVAVSAFSSRTRFAIDPARIGVVESAYPGCIEVHLVNYDYNSRRTAAGGAGLVIGGVVDGIHDGAYLRDRYALLAGFDEVFRIATNYDGVVVLRPTGLGLGFRSELFYQHILKARGPLRTVKKNLRIAVRYQSQVRARIRSLTGNLPGWDVSAQGPFFVRERTESWQLETRLAALTLDQARQSVRALVQEHTAKGWKCGEEASVRGTIQAATDNTVAWLCQKDGISKWLSVECGRPTPPSGLDLERRTALCRPDHEGDTRRAESAAETGQSTWRLSYRGETHEVHLPAGVSFTIADLLKGDGLPSVDQITKATRGGRKVLLNSSLKPTGVLIELE